MARASRSRAAPVDMSLNDLDDESLCLVMDALGLEDKLNLQRVCKRFCSLLNSNCPDLISWGDITLHLEADYFQGICMEGNSQALLR